MVFCHPAAKALICVGLVVCVSPSFYPCCARESNKSCWQMMKNAVRSEVKEKIQMTVRSKWKPTNINRGNKEL